MPLFRPGILTEQMLGEVRYVKTCQGRSGEQVAQGVLVGLRGGGGCYDGG